MLHLILIYIIASIAVEAISEIITSSDITFGFRSYIKKLAFPDEPSSHKYFAKSVGFIDRLISCGYCTSVWVAAALSVGIPKMLDGPIGWVMCIFVLHRISNFIHVVFELVKKGRVKSYDIMYQKSEDLEDGSI